MPEMPVKAAGWRIEPPVSVPVAPGAIRADTAAEEPPEEPPGASAALPPSLRFQGLITLPNALVSLDEPIANWSMLSLPSIPAPASNNLPETVDSYCGTNPLRMPEAAVVSTPLVQNRSLMPSGTPESGLRSPDARAASAASAGGGPRGGVSTSQALSGRP